MRSSVKRLNSANTNDSVILKPDETALTNRRNTVCNDTVRSIFNLQIAIIYHGLTVVTLKVSAHWVRNFRTLKNKYDLTLCQSGLHTASETFVRQNKIGSGSIFCVFASVACILIGRDGEYEKTEKRIAKISDSVCKDLNCSMVLCQKCGIFISNFIIWLI